MYSDTSTAKPPVVTNYSVRLHASYKDISTELNTKADFVTKAKSFFEKGNTSSTLISTISLFADIMDINKTAEYVKDAYWGLSETFVGEYAVRVMGYTEPTTAEAKLMGMGFWTLRLPVSKMGFNGVFRVPAGINIGGIESKVL